MIDKYGNHPPKLVKKIKIPKDMVAVSENRRVFISESETPMQEEVKEEAPDIMENKVEERVEEKQEATTSIPIKTKKLVRKKKSKKFDFHNVPLPVIRVLGTIISLIALIRSFGYVWSYFLRVDTMFFATLMALMLVLVVFIAPQILLHSVRAKKWFVTFLAVILMGLFTYLNIWITISGLSYARNQTDYYVSSGQEHIVKAKRRIDEINIKLEEYKEDKARDAIKRDTLQTEFNRLISAGETTTSYYYTTRNSLRDAEATYKSYEEKMGKLEAEKAILENIEGLDSVIIKDDKTKEREASVDTIFAVALDVAGPIFLAFSLFL